MTINKVKSAIAEQLGISESTISESTNILTDLNADSLDIVQMIMVLETEFNIMFEDEDFSAVKTVADIVSFIDSKKN
ncbi:MAG: acyl carrier protein [Firmicutes bacterium]|nr:acyl carrier protein [Bacillota bacterium]